MWREYVSKRERTTNQSTKFQNSEVAWLTVLTSNFNKPSCRLLELFNKNLRKFSQLSELRKFSALAGFRTFQKSSALRQFPNYLDLENFSITELRKFLSTGKKLEKLRKFFFKSILRKFS